jgi:hypothetical protein
MKLTQKILKIANKLENKKEQGQPLNRKERRLLEAAEKKL